LFTVTDAQINAWLATLFWPFCRIMAVFTLDPFYSSRNIPIRIRAVLSLLISLLIVSSIPPMPAIEVVSPLGIMIMIQQIVIGLAIGYIMRIVFTSIEMAGNLAGLQMGLGFASFYDPQHSANTAVVAQLASLMTLLLFLAMNGHLVVIEMVVRSFIVLPITAEPLKAAPLQTLVLAGGQVFELGLLLALPVVGALLVTNLSIGVMTRAAPQFNVFAVGFPLTLSIGVAALTTTLPQFVPHVQHLIDWAIRLSLQLAKAF